MTEAGLDTALAFPAIVELFNEINSSARGLASTLSANDFTNRTDFLSAQDALNGGVSAIDIIRNQQQTNKELRDRMAEVVAELKSLRSETQAVATHTSKSYSLWEEAYELGLPVVTAP
jgi:hypothetical protein